MNYTMVIYNSSEDYNSDGNFIKLRSLSEDELELIQASCLLRGKVVVIEAEIEAEDEE